VIAEEEYMKKTTKVAKAENAEKKPEAPVKSRRLQTDRKLVSQINILNVKNLANGEVLFARASIIDVSSTGILLRVTREEILAHTLRSTLTLSVLHGISVGFTIEVMDTYIEGEVTRTKPEGRGDFLAAIDFRDDAPDYWRQCFVDLLPDGEPD
jgi:hypothetical protein